MAKGDGKSALGRWWHCGIDGHLGGAASDRSNIALCLLVQAEGDTPVQAGKEKHIVFLSFLTDFFLKKDIALKKKTCDVIMLIQVKVGCVFFLLKARWWNNFAVVGYLRQAAKFCSVGLFSSCECFNLNIIYR